MNIVLNIRLFEVCRIN